MNPLQHFELLRRYDRALNLRTSIITACRPGFHVLDAGCGLGLLSFWAIKGGASRVVAVDVSGVELAEALARENGYADRMQFMEGDLRTLDLADHRNKFDVILAMVYLNDPRRDESQSNLVYSLRDQYLSPNGAMIPDRIRYTVRACDWPSQDYMSRCNEIRVRVSDLEDRYGLSFGPLANAIEDGCWTTDFPAKRSDGRLVLDGSRLISNPITFVEIDYLAAPTPYPDHIGITVNAPGILNSLIWTQELWHEGRLLFANESVSWIQNPSPVAASDHLTIRLERNWRDRNVATIVRCDQGHR